MSSAFASGKNSNAICDRCGFRVEYTRMKALTSDGRPNGLRVCRECWEAEHPQEELGKRPINDPQALRNARPDTGKDASRELSDMDKLDQFLQG